MQIITLDTSVAIPWLIREQSNQAIDSLFQAGYAGSIQLHAPALWLWEFGNVTLEMVKRDRLQANQGGEAFGLMHYARVQIDSPPNGATQLKTLQLANQYQLSFYDAAYLELALRKQTLLATLDRALKRAAKEAGVQCLEL